MNDCLDPHDAISLVPGWDPLQAEIEELKGGLSNRTYLVTYGGERSVLRLDIEDTNVVRFDRSYELSIMQVAHDAGIGPEVMFADSDRGILLTRFLPGRTWNTDDMKSGEQLGRLARLLRLVHSLPTCGKLINYPKEATAYERFLSQRESLNTFASRCVEIVRETPDRGVVACCHNDIIAGNVIDNGDLKLIDWEYALDNDPLFDIACAIAFHDLDERHSAILLDIYAEGAGVDERERLAEQQRTCDALHWLWFAARQAVSPNGLQTRHMERLQQRIH